MGRVDEVVGERLCHVLIDCLMLWINGRVSVATEKTVREEEREREQSGKDREQKNEGEKRMTIREEEGGERKRETEK